jgi:hypothetical protein
MNTARGLNFCQIITANPRAAGTRQNKTIALISMELNYHFKFLSDRFAPKIASESGKGSHVRAVNGLALGRGGVSALNIKGT